MYGTLGAISLFVWMISIIWFCVSLVRFIVPTSRGSGRKNLKWSAIVFALSFAGAVLGSSFEYKDYGLTSREGLAEAKAAAKAKKEAEEAKQAALKREQQAKQEKEDAERRQKQAAEAAAQEAAEREAALRKKCEDKTMAFIMSQEFVKRNLKAPKTAEFPWFSDDQVNVATMPGCRLTLNRKNAAVSFLVGI